MCGTSRCTADVLAGKGLAVVCDCLSSRANQSFAARLSLHSTPLHLITSSLAAQPVERRSMPPSLTAASTGSLA